MDAIVIINVKSKIAFAGTWKTKMGDKKINSETMEREITNPTNTVIDNKMYFLCE